MKGHIDVDCPSNRAGINEASNQVVKPKRKFSASRSCESDTNEISREPYNFNPAFKRWDKKPKGW